MRFLIFGLLISTLSRTALSEEPWSVSPLQPVIVKTYQTQKVTPLPQTSKALRYYQKYISSFDGPKCHLRPTCSGYAAQALHEHGPFIGIVLTADRLMHENSKANILSLTHNHPFIQDWQIGPYREQWDSASEYYGFRAYFKDSVKTNTLWWND
jgi:putative component of membrane protein insertase Oxa1/YidC/SpoIIIJ protein YidD